MELETTLEATIFRLRKEMIQKYDEVGDLRDPSLIELSQELDVFLVEYQRSDLGRKDEPSLK